MVTKTAGAGADADAKGGKKYIARYICVAYT